MSNDPNATTTTTTTETSPPSGTTPTTTGSTTTGAGSTTTTTPSDPLSDETTEEGRPRQTVVMEPGEGHGPHFPSGTNAVEAALAGATANMSDEQLARLRGEAPAMADTTTTPESE
jgi:hypothetical protein